MSTPDNIKTEEFYEGKSKVLYCTNDPHLLIQYFKDDVTANNAEKKGIVKDKGIMNNKISSKIFAFLEENGVPTHFVKQLSDREMLVKKVNIQPIEVVLRNIVAGSLSKRTGITEGQVLSEAICELYYKNDDLGDPMINDQHAVAFGWAKKEHLEIMKYYGLKINDLLKTFFKGIGIDLVDFKIEFGIDCEGQLILADEITPDGCRLWDSKTKEKLDKDRFRRDLGKVKESYEKVLKAVEKA